MLLSTQSRLAEEETMTHFILYGFSLFVFTVALLASGMVVGQAIERARETAGRQPTQ